jgi:hypothetical protein
MGKICFNYDTTNPIVKNFIRDQEYDDLNYTYNISNNFNFVDILNNDSTLKSQELIEMLENGKSIDFNEFHTKRTQALRRHINTFHFKVAKNQKNVYLNSIVIEFAREGSPLSFSMTIDDVLLLTCDDIEDKKPLRYWYKLLITKITEIIHVKLRQIEKKYSDVWDEYIYIFKELSDYNSFVFPPRENKYANTENILDHIAMAHMLKKVLSNKNDKQKNHFIIKLLDVLQRNTMEKELKYFIDTYDFNARINTSIAGGLFEMYDYDISFLKKKFNLSPRSTFVVYSRFAHYFKYTYFDESITDEQIKQLFSKARMLVKQFPYSEKYIGSTMYKNSIVSFYKQIGRGFNNNPLTAVQQHIRSSRYNKHTKLRETEKLLLDNYERKIESYIKDFHKLKKILYKK